MKREYILIGVSAALMAVAFLVYMKRSGKSMRNVYDDLTVPESPEVREQGER